MCQEVLIILTLDKSLWECVQAVSVCVCVYVAERQERKCVLPTVHVHLCVRMCVCNAGIFKYDKCSRIYRTWTLY